MYISINADNVGSKFGDLASQDNEQGLSDLSSSLKEAHGMIDQWVQQQGGKVISSAGDENLFMLQDTSGLEQLLSDYTAHTGNTITVGMGETISQAIKAMIYGKSQGPGTTQQYSPEMDESFNQKDEQQSSDKEVPNDGATLPEMDPTNQIPVSDENSEFEGNGVTEDGGPQVGGPIDQENGVDTEDPIPRSSLEEQAAMGISSEQTPPQQVPSVQSKIPEKSTVVSQQAPKAGSIFGQEKSPTTENTVAPQSSIPQLNAVPVASNTASGVQKPENKQEQAVQPPQDRQDSSDKTIAMPVDNLVDEHKELVNTLESPSHEDDKKEAEEQGSELQDYQAVQDGEKAPEEVEQKESQEGQDNQDSGDLSSVMDSQSEEGEQDGAVQVPENRDAVQSEDDVQQNMNTEDSMNTESEDGVDVETLRDEISQNLLTFRENKQFFEDSKQNNPKLYLATISLLRNMIAMAKELGLTPGKDMDAMAAESQNSDTQSVPKKDAFPPKKDDKKEEASKDSEPKKEEDKKSPPFGKK